LDGLGANLCEKGFALIKMCLRKALIQQGEAAMIYFRLRPHLKDAKDEHLLELAVNANQSKGTRLCKKTRAV
jgi:hypothetical protein